MADRSIEDLAEMLQRLKARTNRSYESLAGRARLSRSSVHRYCSGTAVPADFDSLSRLAAACGADRDELLELHRLWALASAVAHPRSPSTASDAPPAVLAAPVEPVEHADTESTGPPVTVDTPVGLPEKEPPAVAALPGRPRTAHLVLAGLTLALAGALTAAAVGASRWASSGERDTPEAVGSTSSSDSRPLFSADCAGVVSKGQQDECVRELQVLLSRAGSDIDSDFGPQTHSRVLAFQVLAGLPPKGVVDDATKHALYERAVSMASWNPQRVEERIRAVFTEAPTAAVSLARCHSTLDPHWVTVNRDGTRNWGVFQLADVVLARVDGSPARALDPEWNIRMAHRLWRETRDFRRWSACG